ncbi:Polyketide synthase-nonribosomal peptide synthetase [Apiospora rasikravindrae]|uniref:Polyketide synthase-nonribosomal peptide synthetase n=1 Tax=Apiospora rasikravindrae TaxID=990691 RepID=A0ABR1SWD9_9PEZI
MRPRPPSSGGLLREPRDVLEPLAHRFNSQGWYHRNGKHHGHANVQQSYLLAGQACHRRFDAPFFGIHAVEAGTMDPQLRLLLETVYEALEAAGQPMESLRGSDTAVFAGMMIGDYKIAMERDMDSIGTYHVSGVSRAMVANRLSYFFNWHGPSMTIDTACSSSMIAVHQAVVQLRSGQSRVAIAAGSNLILDPVDYVSMSKLEMLSSEGRSRMWDKSANGYARGEGVAAVVLKTLKAAEADGDRIECVIRETATNQDGRTSGITMPSAPAQVQLMRDCYARAGLDPTDAAQRPQYFEAHGTGTLAGDPIEAEAIQTTFFANDDLLQRSQSELFVGSIKTVLGHAESAAGLAGLIKASLALQNSTIPPNLLFSEINPMVEPHYKGLQIPTSAVPWPTVAEGAPRRASVNSFGFGGSNAHAILESYTPTTQAAAAGPEGPPCLPFVFSAASGTSLSSNLSSLSHHLRTQAAGVNMRDLALTLYSRRSRLPFGATTYARSVDDLCQRLDAMADNASMGNETPVCYRLPNTQSGEPVRKSKVLGVFTGQGAQSSRMGASLIEQSDTCNKIVERLELRLGNLPEADRPSWSLKQELLRGEHETRIGQAFLSQPLCTALQILQVELVRAAGVEFSAIVGHSSGEIAAAYCAGAISAEDAICVAYYRGLYSDLAGSSTGTQGAMIVVGTSVEDALELCGDEEFQGRVTVAAINSSASVTLSGDRDAIDKIKTIFEDEGKFVRYVKVDKAYHHASHMEPCADAYLRALHALEIQANEASIPWFSSVDEGRLIAEGVDNLQAMYWTENMVKPVMFKQAVEEAWHTQGPFDLAIEIGPHPALKGPALQTIQDVAMHKIPYTGVQLRGKDAAECFANALGYIWTHLGTVDLSDYGQFFCGKASYNLVTGLPPYAWDYEREYWHESRYSNAIRNRSEPHHDLLGHLTPDSTDQELRWRNILRPKDLPWLKDHALQQQAVFPAAGYVACAIEAAAAMGKARGSSVSLIEVLDLDIAKALTFGPDDSGMETVNSLTDIQHHGNHLEALFKFNASQQFQGPSLTLLASGRVRVRLGVEDEAILPVRGGPEHGLSKVEPADFYKSLEKLEYQYEGQFRALFDLERKLGFASGYITQEPSRLLLHPAVLDAAFQSLFLAHCAPNSGALWSLHVPRKIRAVRVNPCLCAAVEADHLGPISFDCVKPAEATDLVGDIDMFRSSDVGDHAMVQIEGLHCVPFSEPTAQDDKAMFATIVWDVAAPDAERVVFDGEPTEDQLRLARLLDRMAIFFLRHLDREIPSDHQARTSGAYQHYFRFASHTLSLFKAGKLPLCLQKWEDDTSEDLAAAYKPYLHVVDVQLLKAFGDNILEIATGRTQAIEVGMKDDMLSQMYQHGLGLEENTVFLARLVRQIVHRFPHMDILEIGAGTGGATKQVFAEIGRSFSSYTFTDISSGFFDSAQQIFASRADNMTYKVLDISKDIRQQGYKEYSYDLIIASAVLHATPSLHDTLRNVRRLLRPGGFLVVLEIQPSEIARMGTIFGALPGWWLGAEEGRILSPCVNVADWDNLLHATGFSGCDAVAPNRNSLVMPLNVFVSQAVDERVEFLRDPLSSSLSLFADDDQTASQDLVLLGGGGFQTSAALNRLRTLLHRQWGDRIRMARSLTDLSALAFTTDTTVLSLLDVGKSVFEGLEDSSWDALKLLIQGAGTLLWVTSGRRAKNPHANMMVGFLRSAREEMPTLKIQSFDIEGDGSLDASTLAAALLRWKAATMWQREDFHNILLTVEPEVVHEQRTGLVIPRLVADSEMNDRYNSARRFISTPAASVSSRSENFGVTTADDGSVGLRNVPVLKGGTEGAVVRVSHSLRSATRASRFCFAYLVLGTDCHTGKALVALTRDHSLTVSPVVWLSLPESRPSGKEATLIALLAYRLIAHIFLKDIPNGAPVIVHEPNATFGAVLESEAKRRSIQAVFTTTSSARSEPGWVKLHPMASERVIRSSVPANAVAIFDFSGEAGPTSFASRLRAQQPSLCHYESTETTFSISSIGNPQDAELKEINADLQECFSRTLGELHKFDCPPLTVTPDALGNLSSNSPHVVIDWSGPVSGLSVQVKPADSLVRFSDSRTYWLAGLSGGLGLLLCEWMARHGAKYFVISSRSPTVPRDWLERMGSTGAVVKIFSCDITNKSEVDDLYEKIKSTLPSVGGVCQGAMVLQDTAIRQMSLATFSKVTRPKVEGSLHLDRVFQSQDPKLDFFIFSLLPDPS